MFLAYIFLYIYLTKQKLELAIYFLMCLSSFYYFFHLYYLWKSNRTFVPIQQNENDVSEFPYFYLIEQDQKHLYFFHPDGVAHNTGKIQLKWKGWYLTYFKQNVQKYNFKLKTNKNNIYFNIADLKISANVTKSKNKIYGEIHLINKVITFSKKRYNEISFYKGHNQIVTVKKGWLPVGMMNRFRLNTPIICFLERVSEVEKDMILLVLMIIYWK